MVQDGPEDSASRQHETLHEEQPQEKEVQYERHVSLCVHCKVT